MSEPQGEHADEGEGAEEVANGHQHGALVVVFGELRAQGHVRDVVEGHGAAREDGGDQHPGEQTRLARAVRGHPRVEEQVKAQSQGQGGGVEEGVAPPARPLPAVRHAAGDGVGHRVEEQRQGDGQAGEVRRQAEHLVVVEEQEGAEAAGLDAFGGLPRPEKELDAETQAC